jgi:hypothetical protein
MSQLWLMIFEKHEGTARLSSHAAIRRYANRRAVYAGAPKARPRPSPSMEDGRVKASRPSLVYFGGIRDVGFDRWTPVLTDRPVGERLAAVS